MKTAWLITKPDMPCRHIQKWLREKSYRVKTLPYDNEPDSRFPDLICMLQSSQGSNRRLRLLREEEHTRMLPVLLLVPEKYIPEIDIDLPFDDFIHLDCSREEFHARLSLLLKKHHGLQQENLVRVGALKINLDEYEVQLHGQTVPLTIKEFELLKFLATHRGRVFSRAMLLETIWGMDYYGGMRTVDVHIRRLRAKLELHGDVFIETVRGAGYRFTKDHGYSGSAKE